MSGASQSTPPRIALLRLPHAVRDPVYATDGASGADLAAALPEDAPVRLAPMARAAIPTGLAIALPNGFEAQIRPRSGLAKSHGVTLVNAPGTIDADYRGEISVLLINLGDAPFEVTRGLRIAQLVVAPTLRAVFTPVEALPETARGAGGFGSTGRGPTTADEADARARRRAEGER